MLERRKPIVIRATAADDEAPGAGSADDERRLDQIDTDEAAASEARARYRQLGVESVESDDTILPLLAPGERVLALRHSVGLDRRQASAQAPTIDSVRGDLYVTTERLVHVGDEVLDFRLDDVQDSALAGERVLLILRDGVGIVLNADRPRLLRVQIAAARAARAGSPEQRPGRPQSASR
jgi:hypothetical protein